MVEAISFGTDGWRATLDVFTEDRLRSVGQGVATYLADHGLTAAPVGIAYDAREHSQRFSRVLADVLVDNGIDVVRTSRDTPTPVLAWSIANDRLAGGLMVTASHNPPEYNGVKFITAAGAPALPSVTDAIEERLEDPRTLPSRGNEAPLAPIAEYIDYTMNLVDPGDLSELDVVYDGMHGSGRGVTDRLLRTAGANVETYRCTRDPAFGGGSPEPTPETLETMVTQVTTSDADLGIANDGDADRIAVATPERGYLDENLLFAAVYDYFLEEHAGPAVRTVSTSSIVDRVAEAHGEETIETPVGFKWIAAAMREHDALIGGEESGGFSIRGHVREKDGVLMGLLAATMAAEEPLDDRVDRLLDEHGSIVQDKIGIYCPHGAQATILDRIGDTFPSELAGSHVSRISEVDGYKASFEEGGWILVRPSGTEPKLRIYAEGESQSRVDSLLEAGRDVVEPLI